MRKRDGLTLSQYALITTWDRWANCRIVREAGDKDRYELQMWRDGGKVHTRHLNPRTVRSLIWRGILVKTGDVYDLAPEWRATPSPVSRSQANLEAEL